jgi:hypothetical protein
MAERMMSAENSFGIVLRFFVEEGITPLRFYTLSQEGKT